jgi:hypothetical protein
MNWKRVAAMVGIFAMTGVGIASAEDRVIVARTFNNYGLSVEDLREARAYASASLKGAGIDVTWIDCWHGDREAPNAPARCREAIGADLVLRLQKAPKATSERYVSLGFSLVMPEGTPFLATVYADLAEETARRAGVAPRSVLGHAIAHEIGHLLLNTNSHPDAGLMRAAWSQRELRRNDAHDWEFRQPEADTMRAAIASRDGRTGATD